MAFPESDFEINCSDNERKCEKHKEKAKKQLTWEGGAWYYIQALERRGPKGSRRERGNLENDTENERETTVNSEMSFT